MRLLIVDYLDSYSHNIPAFLREASPNAIHVDIKPYNGLDKTSIEFVSTYYHGVVLSAGPGTVDLEADVGEFTPALLSHRPAIPTYGICLGFQAICKHFGGTIRRLSFPHHGLICDVLDPDGNSLKRRATRYHSLEVVLDESAQERLEVLAVAENFGTCNGRSIMEICHCDLPFWGVQYHPESVYSNGCGITVQPFLNAARLRWSTSTTIAGCVKPPTHQAIENVAQPVGSSVAWKCIETDTDILDILHAATDGRAIDYVLLDSSSKGQWDILAAADSASLFQYSVRSQHLSFKSLTFSQENGKYGHVIEECRSTLDEAWSFLSEYSTRAKYVDGPPDVPFWGGFIGYFSYELGLSELGLNAYHSKSGTIPEYNDINLLWSTESLLYNNLTKKLYAISLRQDLTWIESTLKCVSSCKQAVLQQDPFLWTAQCNKIDHPHEHNYVQNIELAQEEINAGNSYELCLTATSRTQRIKSHSGYTPSSSENEPSLQRRFRSLREATPAEFMSLLSLGGVEVLSASPEEFLSYDAQTAIACMKPIKGTLPKIDGHSNNITMPAAQAALHEPKVLAENLMIVDLVRHDLSKVASKVTCPDLMHVRDIGPMYQLISTVQANVDEKYTAWDLIRASIPPGSMTGAPKRRSCEILQRLEKDCRGVYSGITGYIDVRGFCKTSVNIRNAVRYPGEDYWRIGAGGAITCLSDPIDEWHERQLKASSVCRTFLPRFAVLETILWDPRTSRLLHLDEHVTRLVQTLQFFDFAMPKIDVVSETKKGANGTVSEGELSNGLRNHASTTNGVTFNTTDSPGAYINGTSSPVPSRYQPSSDDETHTRVSTQLSDWIIRQVYTSKQQDLNLRLSLQIDVSGHPSLTTTSIPATSGTGSITVHLDPRATLTANLEPFITHKTTNRTHYTRARERAEVHGRDEVLMFRPAQQSTATQGFEDSTTLPGASNDLLTEGSYTNVAVWDSKREQWCTPGTGCLPGIMREKLLKASEIVVGDVERRQILPGTTVKLFNSVRGMFEGVVA